MDEVAKPPTGEPFTCEELIRSELTGKVAASGAYDNVLWKIRTGYVIVLYGALTIAGATKTLDSPWITVILVTGFSFAAGFIDYQFLTAKLRVVVALNRLLEITWRVANGELALRSVDELPRLLRMSGERTPAITLRQEGFSASGTMQVFCSSCTAYHPCSLSPWPSSQVPSNLQKGLQCNLQLLRTIR